MNTSEILNHLENIARGLGTPSLSNRNDDTFVYNDDKIFIEMEPPSTFCVKIKHASHGMEEVFRKHLGNITVSRLGNWINYIESLQYAAIEGIRIRKQEADERALRYQAAQAKAKAARFAPIDDTDIFGKK